MADETNANNPTAEPAPNAPLATAPLATNSAFDTSSTELPDDLARLLNGDNNPTEAQQQATSPSLETNIQQPNTDANNLGTVHLPPEGVVGGETLGDTMDIDSLFNQPENNSNATQADAVNKPIAFDLKKTAMGKVPLQIVAEIGSTELKIEQLMKIGRGAIIEIDRDIDSTIELKIGHHLIGEGHLESEGDYFQVRVVNMLADINEHHTLFHTGGD